MPCRPFCRGACFPISGWLTGLVVHTLSNPDGNIVASETARWALYFFIIALLYALLSLSLISQPCLHGGR